MQEGDHLFLDINGDFKIDITDASITGNTEGTFEVNGKKYEYIVEETLEDNTLRVNVQE